MIDDDAVVPANAPAADSTDNAVQTDTAVNDIDNTESTADESATETESGGDTTINVVAVGDNLVHAICLRAAPKIMLKPVNPIILIIVMRTSSHSSTVTSTSLIRKR